ncbi:MAG TPA: MBL fold metallo-hydrolase [Streptosporangiaceae bacterium]|nr:MBL fold metallo-hydrolase [Streptosporangiaceae bacterium]
MSVRLVGRSSPPNWAEVADRCFQRRYSTLDVTVGVVLGSTGAMVIDTLGSRREAERLRLDLRRLGVRREPRWVVNTHAHFDHCFGNSVFSPRDGVWGHASLPDELAGTDREALAAQFPEWAEDIRADPIAPPDRLVAASAAIDLGDRVVKLHHLGRGHTGGDLVVTVPDARCVYAGDLVEAAGPPAYGADSFPLEWPTTVMQLLNLSFDVLVPGHGEAVDRDFAVRQAGELALVALRIREYHAAGLPAREAAATGAWPYPREVVATAVRRGYAHLDDTPHGTADRCDR